MKEAGVSDIDTKRQLKRWIVIEMITVNLMVFVDATVDKIDRLNKHRTNERALSVHFNLLLNHFRRLTNDSSPVCRLLACLPARLFVLVK